MWANAIIVGAITVAALSAWWWFLPPTEHTDKEIFTNNFINNNEIIMQLTSPAFLHEGLIPTKYSCDGANISPTLSIAGVPKEARSLVLIMDDPDVPKALRPDGVFDHWTLYNIPPTTTLFEEGGLLGTAGANGRGDAKYTGPCPPQEYQPTMHRYFFRLYALDVPTLQFAKLPTKKDLLAAMEGHVIATTELMGTYDRAAK